jgi:hypothetical protein
MDNPVPDGARGDEGGVLGHPAATGAEGFVEGVPAKLQAVGRRMLKTYNTIQRHGSLNKKNPEDFAAHARLRSATPPCVEHEINTNNNQQVGLTP